MDCVEKRTNDSDLVSIIIPCRNEEQFIVKCLDSVIGNDYQKDRLEVLVVDGMSEDGTRQIVHRYMQQYQFIRLLENQKKIAASAFNVGIKHSNGNIIMIMSAHATYEKDYISKCVKVLVEHNAHCVGGIWKIVPRNHTTIGKNIVRALSHPFGIGNAHYRVGNSLEPKLVDAVAYGCYKKEVFDKIGFFNEKLVRSEDIELNLRLKSAGGRILLVPDAVVFYYARSDFRSFCKYNFINGVWATYPLKFVNHMPVSWRHLVPLVFVSGLIGSALLSSFSWIFLWIFLLIAISHSALNLYFSIEIALREKDFRYFLIMPLVFSSLHVCYGVGSLWGLLRVIVSRLYV